MSWKFVQKWWAWILGIIVVLYVLALNPARDSAAGESLPCTMRVTADVLNVRSGPGTDNRVVDRLSAGEVVSAEGTIENGFRQLRPGRWAAQRYLDQVPGCNCG